MIFEKSVLFDRSVGNVDPTMYMLVRPPLQGWRFCTANPGRQLEINLIRTSIHDEYDQILFRHILLSILRV